MFIAWFFYYLFDFSYKNLMLFNQRYSMHKITSSFIEGSFAIETHPV